MGDGGIAVFDDATTIARSDRAVHRELADGAGVVLHLDSGAYFSLNAVGLMIWGLLEEMITLGDLLDELRSRIPDAPPELARDVQEFLEALQVRDLVSLEGGASD